MQVKVLLMIPVADRNMPIMSDLAEELKQAGVAHKWAELNFNTIGDRVEKCRSHDEKIRVVIVHEAVETVKRIVGSILQGTKNISIWPIDPAKGEAAEIRKLIEYVRIICD